MSRQTTRTASPAFLSTASPRHDHRTDRVWVTDDEPADHRDGFDHAEQSDRLEPPAEAARCSATSRSRPIGIRAPFRRRKRQANAEWFAAMNGAHLQPDTSRHPAMHRSRSDRLHHPAFRRDHADPRQGRADPEALRLRDPARHKPCLGQSGVGTALLMAVLIDDDTTRAEDRSHDRDSRCCARTVLGAGTIGASWCAFFLAKDLDVVAYDVGPDSERTCSLSSRRRGQP